MSTPPVIPPGQNGPMDSPGLAVMLSTVAQQQTSIAADLGAIRTDIARVATRVEVAESERKIAAATQTDHETRIRALER